LNVDPWYRQSRNGDVQGRSGGASDDKADSNSVGANPSAPVGKSAGPVVSTHK